MPTASDLVTDLPADFETFGQAVATSMADLLGGTTGQVLSKASNTDMDFTWVAQDDSNAIQNAIVDAKGDLIAATAADTPARLAVGTNGQVLTADSTAATGLKWAAAASGTTFKGASIYAGSVQNILNNTWTLMTFNSELWDSDGFHSTSTNTSRMTIPTGLGGKYLMTASIVWGDRNATGARIMQIQKNGGTYFFGLQQIPSSTVYMGNSMSVVVEGVAGDYFEVLVNQNSGSTLATGSGANDQFVQISYLGA
jgi:hypothetical protein